MKKLNIIVNIIFALMVVSILGYGIKKEKKENIKLLPIISKFWRINQRYQLFIVMEDMFMLELMRG